MIIDAGTWAGIAGAVVAVLSGASAVVGWTVKHYLYELKPNGGSSLKDSVNRLEKRVDDLYTLIAEKQ
jgi:hypothetical protein